MIYEVFILNKTIMKRTIRLTESELTKVIIRMLKETDDLPMNNTDDTMQVLDDTFNVLGQQKIISKDDFCSKNIKADSVASSLSKKLSSKLPPEQAEEITSKMLSFVKGSDKATILNSIKTIKGLISNPKEAVKKIFQMIGVKVDQNDNKSMPMTEQGPGYISTGTFFLIAPLVVMAGMFIIMNIAWLIETIFTDKKHYCNRY